MKKLSVFIYLLVSLALPVFGSDNAGAFIERGIGARSAGMGMSFVSMANDSTAVYWNPAGMVRLTQPEVNFFSAQLIETDYVNFQAVGEVMSWHVGVGYNGATLGDIYKTELNPDILRYRRTGEMFAYKGMALFLALSKRVTEKLSFGTAIKYLNEELDDYRGQGVGMDLSLLHEWDDVFTFGVNLQNIVPAQMVWNTPSKNIDTVPLNAKLGVNAKLFEDTLFIATDLNLRKNRPLVGHVGTEFWFNPYLPVRVGLDKIIREDNGVIQANLSVGTGLRLKGLKLDVSWTDPNGLHFFGNPSRYDVELDHVFRFSVGYAIGR